MEKSLLLILLSFSALTACVGQSQNEYTFSEVGQSTLVEFGTVLRSRPIMIDKDASGVGAVMGGVAGAGAGSAVGGGHGRVYTGIAGGVAGAVIGNAAEHALGKENGIEYTIATEKGKVYTIAQVVKKDDMVFAPNTRVMVQTSGSYQRVLSADGIPTAIQRPKGVEMTD